MGRALRPPAKPEPPSALAPNTSPSALKYYVACTADGFIAHADGSFDGFLMEGEHVADFLESYKWFDTVLMGRKAYEVGLREGKTNPYPMLRSFVFSRAMKASPDPNVTQGREVNQTKMKWEKLA